VPADATLWAVVLAGGIGSRFWPLSSPQRPKQLLSLVSERPLIAETVERLQPLVPTDRILVLTSQDIARGVHAAVPQVPPHNLLVEPRPLGTAAALAWAAREISGRAGPQTIFASVHADLAAAFPDAFRHVLREASRRAALDDVLVTVGSRATRPDPGFGYLVPGEQLLADEPLSRGGACVVARFVEKPSREVAEELLAQGAWWNAGILVARAGVLLAGLREHAGELAGALEALERRDLEAYAARTRPISYERALLERSRDVVMVPGEFGWDDVGTWPSLRRARELDDDGNGAIGRAHFVDASTNVVHCEHGDVVIYGLEGLLVVTLPGLTFVTSLERAADLKPLLDVLPPSLRQGLGAAGPPAGDD
jgi:mannose-1-phosphate guanylyltransferase